MKNGFTLIELIISIFILSIVIVGIFGAFSAMVVATSDTSNQFIATYLAQEGMEIVTDIRNNNPAGPTWNNGLTGCASGCEADYTTGGSVGVSYPMTPWGLSPDGTYGHYLLTDATSGFYNYTGGTKTKFKREIIITCFDASDAVADCSVAKVMKVSVTVYWDKKASLVSAGGLGAGFVTVEENLYNYK